MTATAEDVLTQAKSLSPDERELVALQLVASLEEDFDPALVAELERRHADYLAGKMQTVPLEQVMAEAMARLR
ncbi:MAG: hypothetical protein B9S33_01295 [Pedosphaera sp. Tous-C6FEB]|nr:MAG: hypothetical protein B9S33_01295 [Pedosphaera sp. Tous-C6FEB]